MRPYFWLLLCLLALCLVFPALATERGTEPTDIPWEDLTLELSRAEVLALLGEPCRVSLNALYYDSLDPQGLPFLLVCDFEADALRHLYYFQNTL